MAPETATATTTTSGLPDNSRGDSGDSDVRRNGHSHNHHSRPVDVANSHRDDGGSGDSSDSDCSAPLFDPSGLGSSLSSSRHGRDSGSYSNSRDGVDLNSHSAFRLGISPIQRQTRPSSSFRSFSTHQQQTAKAAAGDVVNAGLPASPPRGRPESRAEGYATATPPLSTDPSTASLSSMSGSAGGPREWWRRDRSEASSVEAGPSRPTSQRDPLSIAFNSSQHPSRMASDPGAAAMSTSSPTMGRSPAAAFLSSFAGNSTAAAAQDRPTLDTKDLGTSAQAYLRAFTDLRGKSLSPTRSGEHSLASSPLDASSSGFQGLGGAAANLLRRDREPSNTDSVESLPTPDDEGFRFGPDARYRLGKQLGVGGFSTIREGWDSAAEDGGEPHRVAVKLTYRDLEAAKQQGHELAIWRNLPTHAHLLPLLYDERMIVERPTLSVSSKDGASPKQELELVVMPLCDAGNLLEHIRSEGLRKVAGDSTSGSLSRSQSIQRTLDGAANDNVRSPQTPASASLLSRSGPRTSSAHSPSGMQRVPSGTSVRSNSIMRSSSMRGPRSQGLSLPAARVIVQQLALALECLHAKANVVHGDIKLENVLAQSARPGKLPQMLANSPALCWRLADFGLSRKVDEQANGGRDARPEYIRSWSSSSRISMDRERSNERQQQQQHGGGRRHSGIDNFGGSTAYSAPEVWRDDTTLASGMGTDATSPYASDMWALGCVVYALLSGKLPFNDSFEPRLQAKIARGEWEMPPRLWRRARRLASGAHPGPAHERASSVRSGSDASDSAAVGSWVRQVSSPGGGGGGDGSAEEDAGQRRYSTPGMVDLSASLPELPSPRAHAARMGLQNLASAHEGHVVGSVPSRPGAPDRFEIDTEAQAAADAEADAESDDDATVDQSWDGVSGERASAREVLRGLLEPDPALRWTIGRLINSRWLKAAAGSSGEGDRRGVSATRRGSEHFGLTKVTEGVAVGDEGKAVSGAVPTPTRNTPPVVVEERSARATPELQFDKEQRPPPSPTNVRRPSSLSRSRPSDGGVGVGEGVSRSSTPGRHEQRGGSEDGDRGLHHPHLRPLSTHSSRTSLVDGGDVSSASASVIIHDDCERERDGRDIRVGTGSPHLERRGRGRTRSRFMDEVKEDELLSHYSHDDGAEDDVGEVRRARSRPRPIPLPGGGGGAASSSSAASSRSSSRAANGGGGGGGGNRSKSTSRIASATTSSSKRFWEYGNTADDLDDDAGDEADHLSMRDVSRRGSGGGAGPRNIARPKRSSSSASQQRGGTSASSYASSSMGSSSWKTRGGGGPPNLLSTSATTVSSLSGRATASPHFEYGSAGGGGSGGGGDSGGGDAGAGAGPEERGRRSVRGRSGASASNSTSTSGSGSTSRSRSRAPDALSQLLRGGGGRRAEGQEPQGQ